MLSLGGLILTVVELLDRQSVIFDKYNISVGGISVMSYVPFIIF